MNLTMLKNEKISKETQSSLGHNIFISPCVSRISFVELSGKKNRGLLTTCFGDKHCLFILGQYLTQLREFKGTIHSPKTRLRANRVNDPDCVLKASSSKINRLVFGGCTCNVLIFPRPDLMHSFFLQKAAHLRSSKVCKISMRSSQRFGGYFKKT